MWKWILSERIKAFICLCVFFLSFFPLLSIGETVYSTQEANKVFRIIAEIDQAIQNNESPPYKRVKLTERELNAYMAYRIEFERSLVLKELTVKLFDGNRIEGKIFIDLRGYEPPQFLRPEMNFYFAGILEVKGDKVRLDLKELFLEDQKISPALLDIVIFLAAKIQGEEASGIGEWYDLPLGIKEIDTYQGEVWFRF